MYFYKYIDYFSYLWIFQLSLGINFSFILLSLEDAFCVTPAFLSLSRFALWPSVLLILVNVPYAYETNVVLKQSSIKVRCINHVVHIYYILIVTFVCFALLTLVTEKGVLKLSPIIVDFFPHIISPNFCSMYFGIILLGANTFVFIQLPINRPFYNYEKKSLLYL